jgi:hypothetical protein
MVRASSTWSCPGTSGGIEPEPPALYRAVKIDTTDAVTILSPPWLSTMVASSARKAARSGSASVPDGE